jgi:chromosomal replication initiation ATPase DnaA
MISANVFPGIKTEKGIIAESFGIKEIQLLEKTRIREVIDARHFYFWHLTNNKHLTNKEIKNKCGYRFHHSTIIHGIRNAETLMKVDRDYKFKAESALINLKSIKQ